MSKMWGGRFQDPLDPRIERLNRSFAIDARLYAEDVEGSLAWARALRRAGLLKEKELRAITRGLKQVAGEFDAGTFRAKVTDEDIHTAVERRLGEVAGDAAKKLHTGRSRNDQVATDLHLWLKGALGALDAHAAMLQQACVDAADRAGAIAIPAYTHLQRAQPVFFAHHWLAYVEMLARDRGRLTDARTRADVLPLGCGAAAGTGFRIDRRALARDLGFKRAAGNSLDAVGSRDAALEFLAACAVLATHLSRLGAEIVQWASAEFGFVALSDAVSTGSSLLPQKRNPDGAELARGKAGRVTGRLVGLLGALHGLPLAYNKDLQEDKEAVFDAFDTTIGVCAALVATVEGLTFVPDRCAAALAGGHLLATELADYLVRKGMPFRTAHGVVGGLVQTAEERGVDLAELDLATLQAAAKEIDGDVKRALTVPAALASKRALGGTAPARVRRAIAVWRRRLGS